LIEETIDQEVVDLDLEVVDLEVALAVDSVVDLEVALAVDSVVDLEAILDQEKCIRQFAVNAKKNAKFRSNLQKANQFTVEIVSPRKSQDIRLWQ